MERAESNSWAIVLAGGEGKRLQSITRDAQGDSTPKQYCSLGTGRPLVWDAIERASQIAPRERILVVVAEHHERWWRPQLASMPRGNVIVQPRNRGTAAGVLLPLLHVATRDPEGTVLLVPSDHYVEDERALWWCLHAATESAADDRDGAVLVGITPDAPETEYGWIVPRTRQPLARVEAFVEKPARAEAERLQSRGALWNSFLLAARADALLGLYRARLPSLLAALRGAPLVLPRELARRYEQLEERDFCRSLLERAPERLRVARAPACGWSDLGTPRRLESCVRRLGPRATDAVRPRGPRATVDLARAIAHCQLA